MKRDFCLKQSQVLRASTELPRDPPWSVSGMLSITTLPIAILKLVIVDTTAVPVLYIVGQ